MRHLLCVSIAAASLALSFGKAAMADPVLDAVQAIAADLEARVGFYLHDTHTGETLSYNADARFPVNSTFKLFACGALLAQVDAGSSSLATSVSLATHKIEAYSPAIKALIAAKQDTITLEHACRMMLSVSDNTAANIVLAEVGGPKGLTTFMRALGDTSTRLDRWEPELNQATPGDPRDTTTPRASALALHALILGDALSPQSNALLLSWLADHRVADDLFRAALPEAWHINDRTGAGGYGARSIIAVLYPPGRKPIVSTLFLTETPARWSERNQAIARVGQAIVAKVSAH